jgi:hypothetical protein
VRGEVDDHPDPHGERQEAHEREWETHASRIVATSCERSEARQ